MSESGHRKTQEVVFESETLVFTVEISAMGILPKK